MGFMKQVEDFVKTPEHGVCGWRAMQNDKLRLRKMCCKFSWSAAFQRKRLFHQKQRGSGNLFNVSEVIYDPVCAVFTSVSVLWSRLDFKIKVTGAYSN